MSRQTARGRPRSRRQNDALLRPHCDIASKRGTPIPTNDVWIAAQALQHNLTLDTRDEHFRKVPGLKLWRG
ncbi:MAG: PIN domain-containing protein [Pirellulales bacterium]|nr:PIN domain-containing protein [Pirellulales bacterium]